MIKELYLKTGKLKVKEVNNIDIFNVKLSPEFANLQVPKFYIEEQDRYIDNYDNPDYHEALKLRQFEKQQKGYLNLLEKSIISVETTHEIHKTWNKLYRSLQNNYLLEHEIENYSEQALMVKYIILGDDKDKADLIDFALLHENRIYEIMNLFNVTRNGENIFRYPLKFSVDTRIDYDQIELFGYHIVHPFDEYMCCKESNLSWEKWLTNEYSKSTKETTIALWRLARVISNHNEDAVAIENEKKSKK